MGKNTKFNFLLLLVMFFLISNFSFLITSLYGDVHTSTSCDRAAVQAAINDASDGDAVFVPAGTSIWNSGIGIDNKNIVLKGAGISQTVIIDSTTWGVISVTNGTGKPFRITGFSFEGTGNFSGDSAITVAEGSYFGFRIDHCRFYNERHAVNFGNKVRPEGLIDHCTHYCLENKGSGDHVAIYSYADGETAWKRPLGLGTSNAVYIEDCYFEYSTAVNSDRPITASRSGARVVFRYNRCKNGMAETFSWSSVYRRRGSVYYEAYNNVYTGSAYITWDFRGGVGNFFNNTITGSYGSGLRLQEQRVASSFYPYGKCDGMNCLDGNLGIDTGAHTGASNQPALTCAGKNWTANQWVGYALWNVTDYSAGRITANTNDTITTSGMVEGYTIVDTGTHTAADNQSKLTCAGKSWGWTTFSDLYIYNITDGSIGKITNSSPDTITAVLTGGTDNNWDTGDVFQVCQCFPRTGIEKDWDTGDMFKIANGYPCVDQVGWTTDAGPDALQPQTPCPLYEWNNTINGGDMDASSDTSYIQEGRDFYNDTPRPGYTPYTYPHPLVLTDIVDTSSPTAPSVVCDGTGTTDISSTTSRTQLSANWTAATDEESGISNYQYAIGTAQGATNVTNSWISNNTNTAVTKTGLNLTVGITYYFSVKATNGAGLTGAVANSNGQVVISTAVADTTPPSSPGPVRDGPTAGTDASFTYSTTTLSANWTVASDGESDIANYQYAIDTAAGGTNITNWTTIGNVLTVTRTGLVLTIGTTYYFSVRAINGYGLAGTAANSNGQYVKEVNTADTTPPDSIAQVRDGNEPGIDADVTYLTDELSANWDNSADLESGISRYYYAIGSSPGATDITGWTPTGNGELTGVTQTGLSLATGTTYYFSVKAENGVGLQSTPANSDGVCIISGGLPPVISNVQATDITANSAVIIWDTDMPATSQVEYGLTVIYGNSTTEDSSLVTVHSVAITGLTAGQAYHYRVISKDSNGNQSVSADFTFSTLPALNSVPDIRAYPNPYSLSGGQQIKFSVSSQSEAEVDMYTMTGKLVKKLRGTSQISWDGTNEDSQKVARGIYIYKITENSGDKVTGKIAITR